jgi:CspA family cold shock protein
MAVGVVRSFNNDKGYGFIETDEGELLFVHHSSIEMEGFRTLSPGAKVLFEIEVGKRGPEAKQVRKI